TAVSPLSLHDALPISHPRRHHPRLTRRLISLREARAGPGSCSAPSARPPLVRPVLVGGRADNTPSVGAGPVPRPDVLPPVTAPRSEEHTSELQSRANL